MSKLKSITILLMIVTFCYPAISAYIQDDAVYWEQQYQELLHKIEEKRSLAKSIVFHRDVLDTNALILSSDKTPGDVLLRRTQLLLQDLKSKSETPTLDAYELKLKMLQSAHSQGLAKSVANGAIDSKSFFLELNALNKQLALTNPLLDFDDLLFIGYKFPSNEVHMCDQYNPWNVNTGGGLYILKGFKTSSPELLDVLKNSKVENGRFKGSNLSGGAFLSPDLSYDGKTIVFAWSPSADKCYHIFKVNIDGTRLIQLTDGSSNEFNYLTNSNHNDFDPIWLPNGRIAFISDRRGGFGRCHTKGKPTFTLHSMKDDGTDIICLSYHETNEWHPSVDNDGKIVYTRWDYVDRDDCIAHHLWTCYPDGRDPRSHHGNYPFPYETFTGSSWRDGRWDRPNAEFNIRPIPNSQKYIATAAGHHGYTFGELITIDPFIEDDGKVSQVKRITTAWTNWPDFITGPYGTAWPLSEDYYICNKNNTLILRDRFGGEQLIYSNSSWRPIDPIPVKARVKPPEIATATWQGERKNRADHYRATIKVQNVYTSDIPLPPNTVIKHMRIVQVFPKETRLVSDPRNGYPGEALTRMSLGTVPVETDGSVYCEAPVGKILYFQLLDDKGLAVHSMRSATYVHEGEQLSCVGCHENKWKAPPGGGSRAAFLRAPSKLIPEAGGLEPVNFHRLVKPVFNNKCAPCHRDRANGPDMSFGSLKNFAFYFCGDGNPYLNGDIVTPRKGGSRTTPGKFGAAYSGIFKNLNSSHYNVSLTADEYKRITLWLDLNSMELGAEYNVSQQRNSQLVWPRIDLSQSNPQGIEIEFPLKDSLSSNVKEKAHQIQISRNGSSVILNSSSKIISLSIFNLSGRLINKISFNKDARPFEFDLTSLTVSKGIYICKLTNHKPKDSFRHEISNFRFIVQ